MQIYGPNIAYFLIGPNFKRKCLKIIFVQFIAKNCSFSTIIKIHVPSVSAHIIVVEITLKLSNMLLNDNSHESGNKKN